MNGESDGLLHAYHDGELTGVARWRFERELRRSPVLRAELEQVVALGEMLRARDAAEPSPDLWDAISAGLPALDARRIEDLVEPTGASWGDWLGPWWKPMGAVAATAAVALAVVYGGFWQETPTAGGVVRWIDSGDRSVMVLDDDAWSIGLPARRRWPRASTSRSTSW
jgi:hypothetical protein